MLERVKGNNGEIVGSKAYFEKINKDTLLGELLKKQKRLRLLQPF